MKSFFSFLPLLCAFACSSAESADYAYETNPETGEVEELELGTAEQAITTQQASAGASLKWSALLDGDPGAGVRLTSSCQSGQSTTVQCFVPSSKTLTVQALNAFAPNNCTTAAFDNMVLRVGEYVSLLSTELSGSGWTVSTGGAGSTLTIVCDTSLPGGGTLISNYVHTQPISAGTTLTESLPGGFVSNSTYFAKLDGDAILALGTSTLNDVKAMRHAVGNAMVKRTGTGDSSASGVVSRNTISGSGDTAVGAFTAGEKCRARNFSVSGSTTFGTSTSAGCNNT